ncbi:hypothetical protein ACFPM0_32995 [Pseudonocardia sulfidoxydans]|uniref:hypothetical protein n=1 Tax=Pseudonocardia sulfidoxydans TaxID=54011 RepID=UPI0036211EB9
MARRRPLDPRPRRTGLALLDGVGFLAPGEYALLRPDHVVAWRGTDPADASRVRAALLAGTHPPHNPRATSLLLLARNTTVRLRSALGADRGRATRPWAPRSREWQ